MPLQGIGWLHSAYLLSPLSPSSLNFPVSAGSLQIAHKPTLFLFSFHEQTSLEATKPTSCLGRSQQTSQRAPVKMTFLSSPSSALFPPQALCLTAGGACATSRVPCDLGPVSLSTSSPLSLCSTHPGLPMDLQTPRLTSAWNPSWSFSCPQHLVLLCPQG